MAYINRKNIIRIHKKCGGKVKVTSYHNFLCVKCNEILQDIKIRTIPFAQHKIGSQIKIKSR